MLELIGALVIGALLFFAIMLYVIAREKALKFLVQISVALVAAYGIYRLGYSEQFALLGLGTTLSLIYFMR